MICGRRHAECVEDEEQTWLYRQVSITTEGGLIGGKSLGGLLFHVDLVDLQLHRQGISTKHHLHRDSEGDLG